jgi:hypothetical protein
MQEIKHTNCYICNKKLGKSFRDIDIIIDHSFPKKKDGLVIKLSVHNKCFNEFISRFLDICGGRNEIK